MISVGGPAGKFADLWSEVEHARESLEGATRRESEARKDRSGCLNRLNSAQKALDEFLAAARNAAPIDSDWGEQRRAKARGEG